MIYFIQQGADGPIKIGYAHDVGVRLNNLQSANPYPLKLMASCQGDVRIEKKIHIKFGEHKIKGEWFQADDSIIAYALSVNGTVLSPDTVRENGLDALLMDIEISEIREALETTRNKRDAADYLKISYRSLRHRIKKYEIDISA